MKLWFIPSIRFGDTQYQNTSRDRKFHSVEGSYPSASKDFQNPSQEISHQTEESMNPTL